MTTRSEQLAQEFKKANNEFIALIERLDKRQWRARCAAEGWTVAVAAYHIGEDAPLLVDFAQMVANGKPLPDFTVDAVDSMNGEQAARNANCTKQQVLELLRRNGAEAASALRGLTDAQLDNAVLLPDYHPIRVLDGLQERVS
ncbi:MAG TPA: maleylpyruvate isomerase N-terminal domain-containing protein, partial [Dehalococcoidia bacterium]|nr:maleylpyruvate isomerase N-terminal domain-containing protein [Dehalococcoidia bacterium]